MSTLVLRKRCSFSGGTLYKTAKPGYNFSSSFCVLVYVGLSVYVFFVRVSFSFFSMIVNECLPLSVSHQIYINQLILQVLSDFKSF